MQFAGNRKDAHVRQSLVAGKLRALFEIKKHHLQIFGGVYLGRVEYDVVQQNGFACSGSTANKCMVDDSAVSEAKNEVVFTRAANRHRDPVATIALPKVLVLD